MPRFRLAFFALALCCTPAIAADDFTAEKAKALIPDAAGMPIDEVKELGSLTDVSKFKPSRGDTLTWWMWTHIPPDGEKLPTSFNFLGTQVNPAAIAVAVSGPKDVFGRYRKMSTVIHPEYITDCTCKVDGDAATGTVTFKAEKAYEGKIEYTARKANGAWRIEEFRLPDLKTTLTLGADGKWVKK